MKQEIKKGDTVKIRYIHLMLYDGDADDLCDELMECNNTDISILSNNLEIDEETIRFLFEQEFIIDEVIISNSNPLNSRDTNYYSLKWLIEPENIGLNIKNEVLDFLGDKNFINMELELIRRNSFLKIKSILNR